MKIGLVLEGGANRGVFTSGVLDFFMEQGIVFPYIIGTSAGACNAMNYIAGQIGRGRDSVIHKRKECEYFGVKTLLKTGYLFDMDKAFWELPNSYFPFDYDAYFANTAVQREYTATDCNTGKAVYLTDQGNDRRYLMRIAQASAALPGAAKPVVVDGVVYADGGVADSIPVRRAFFQGCDKVVVVQTRRKEFRMKPSKSTKFIARRNRQYPALVQAMYDRPKHYNRTLAYICKQEAAGKVFSIRPEMQEVSRMEKDYHKLMKFYHHGYQQAKAMYPALLEFLKEEDWEKEGKTDIDKNKNRDINTKSEK